jgi:PAS domain S-box-containing protein
MEHCAVSGVKIDVIGLFDYTTRMQTDEFLRNDRFLSKELLRLALDSSGLGVWKVDPRTRDVALNASLKQMLDLPIDRNLDYAGFFALLHPDDRDDARKGLSAALLPDSDGNCEIEFRVVMPSSDVKWLLARGRAFFQGKGKKRAASLFIGTMRDITATKTAAEHQQTLIHEVNHRVKNSLQLVSSLLRLQARRSAQPESRQQLEDATARISTIAHIHQRLYRDQDTKQLNFGAFLSELCADMEGTSSRCSLTVETPNFHLSTDRSIPLALMVNELVTNAFKYAYPNSGGPVMVTVDLHDAGEISVAVSDKGVGVPEGFSIDGAGNMGMMLIGSLAQQLSGRVEVKRNHGGGSCFTVTVQGGDRRSDANI